MWENKLAAAGRFDWAVILISSAAVIFVGIGIWKDRSNVRWGAWLAVQLAVYAIIGLLWLTTHYQVLRVEREMDAQWQFNRWQIQHDLTNRP